MRLDKWLFCTRLFKSREKAAAAIEAGTVRLNGETVLKPGKEIKPGDGLVVPQGSSLRVVRIEGLPGRRGPAAEAHEFYTDLEAGPDQPAPR